LREHATLTVTAQEADSPIEGNVLASGDDEEDRRAEDEVRSSLEFTVWAWATVTVTAELAGFKGRDYLGACSYASEDAFRVDGDYIDMIDFALGSLADEIISAKVSITALAEILAE